MSEDRSEGLIREEAHNHCGERPLTGFFYNIRSLLGAKHSGKYFSELLRELALQEPKAFAKIFELKPSQARALEKHALQVEREWRFFGAAGNMRFADLAILEAGEPILLLEVKEDDVNNQSNLKQLEDYLALVDGMEGRSRFAHVSRYSPATSDRNALKGAGKENAQSYRYRDVHAGLTDLPFSCMLSDYLRDIGVTKYEIIDLVQEQKEIAFFLAQALGLPHKNGLGKLYSRKAVTAVPDIIRKLYGNTEALGEWIKDANPSLLRHSSSRKFRSYPTYDLKGLKRALSTNNMNEDEGNLPGTFGQFVNGGSVNFFANCAIGPGDDEAKKGNWLYIQVGYGLILQRDPENEASPVSLLIYAGFEGNRLAWTEAYAYLKDFPSEQSAHRKFGALIAKAKRQALTLDSAEVHASLKDFIVPE